MTLEDVRDEIQALKDDALTAMPRDEYSDGYKAGYLNCADDVLEIVDEALS